MNSSCLQGERVLQNGFMWAWAGSDAHPVTSDGRREMWRCRVIDQSIDHSDVTVSGQTWEEEEELQLRLSPCWCVSRCFLMCDRVFTECLGWRVVNACVSCSLFSPCEFAVFAFLLHVVCRFVQWSGLFVGVILSLCISLRFWIVCPCFSLDHYGMQLAAEPTSCLLLSSWPRDHQWHHKVVYTVGTKVIYIYQECELISQPPTFEKRHLMRVFVNILPQIPGKSSVNSWTHDL